MREFRGHFTISQSQPCLSTVSALDRRLLRLRRIRSARASAVHACRNASDSEPEHYAGHPCRRPDHLRMPPAAMPTLHLESVPNTPVHHAYPPSIIASTACMEAE
jgi:hypothetical protein